MPSNHRQGIVIALGGNALTDPADEANGVAGERNALSAAFDSLVEVIREQPRVLVTHGNGPQVGNHLLRSDLSEAAGLLPPLPINACVADTAGGLGHLVGREARNAMVRAGVDKDVLVTITTVSVADLDEAPKKSVGQAFAPSREAELRSRGWSLRHDESGLRRVVPSPAPVQILELKSLAILFQAGVLIIAGGGGGVPVSMKEGRLEGVEGVVDKDLTASLLAQGLNADTLVICTNVEGVYLDYGGPEQCLARSLTVTQTRELIAAGAFGEGSMLPKVAAASEFIAAGGRNALICHIDDVAAAINGDAGTAIIPDHPQ